MPSFPFIWEQQIRKGSSGSKSGNAPRNISRYSLDDYLPCSYPPFSQSLYQRYRNYHFRASLFKNRIFIFCIFAWELVFEKVFQAVGKMNVSMICLMSGCLVNIFLDPVLIFGLGPFPSLGIEGAALATGLGQTFSAILYLIFT